MSEIYSSMHHSSSYLGRHVMQREYWLACNHVQGLRTLPAEEIPRTSALKADWRALAIFQYLALPFFDINPHAGEA